MTHPIKLSIGIFCVLLSVVGFFKYDYGIPTAVLYSAFGGLGIAYICSFLTAEEKDNHDGGV